MRWTIGGLVVGVVGLSSGLAVAAERRCPRDSVQSGNICIDKYEASVWETTDVGLIRKIKNGTVTLAHLTAAGATQHGVTVDDYGTGCPRTGNGCVNFYAVSIPGVMPSRFLNWFQAAAAARNSGKRLVTNAEWQAAALGTPDPHESGGADNGSTTCNTDNLAPGPTATGSRSECVSDVGAFDMVGNIEEWVADWVPRSPTFVCGSWGTFSSDSQCLFGAATTGPPGALLRGGAFNGSTGAGVFAVVGFFAPSPAGGDGSGFRAAR
jgi:hypothetical protein